MCRLASRLLGLSSGGLQVVEPRFATGLVPHGAKKKVKVTHVMASWAMATLTLRF
jgi:hypothetical protein